MPGNDALAGATKDTVSPPMSFIADTTKHPSNAAEAKHVASSMRAAPRVTATKPAGSTHATARTASGPDTSTKAGGKKKATPKKPPKKPTPTPAPTIGPEVSPTGDTTSTGDTSPTMDDLASQIDALTSEYDALSSQVSTDEATNAETQSAVDSLNTSAAQTTGAAATTGTGFFSSTLGKVVLVAGLGVVAYFWWRSSKNKPAGGDMGGAPSEEPVT